MSLPEQILLTHRLLPQQIIRLDTDLFRMLDEIAAAQDKSVSTLVLEMLYTGVYEKRTQATIDYRWQTLTFRKQQVAALACLGYTNSEIAHHLTISINTVRAHMRNILEKYNLSSKSELRLMLAGWDFRGWLESQQWVEGI